MINQIITKANGKDKVVDFRDNLILANGNDYAMMQGAGGKDHAPNSTIKVTICDFSVKEKSVTVSANISTDVAARLFTIASAKIAETTTVPSQGIEMTGLTISKEGQQFINQALDKARAIMPKDASAVPAQDFIEIGKLLAKANQSISEPKEIKPASGPDFLYTADKVDVYRKAADGTAPVNRVSFAHQSIRNDGQVSKYPWTIKITNGIAPIKESSTGATTFDGSNMRDKTEGFIMVSDADFYKMLYRVNRFIEVWENTFCIPLIKQGETIRQQEREAYAANRS